ncbi:hypothetical protein CHARACLAT_004865 [Characodon lateralis]|uniref:Uncharacterized protein n=1 Tax=Characodon lateralis TaxID=208331 RepID=A0ABU7DXR6_9TELE|nr:hypothetical protein [Characodon lateralis]
MAAGASFGPQVLHRALVGLPYFVLGWRLMGPRAWPAWWRMGQAGGSVPHVSTCACLGRGLLLLCFNHSLPLCGAYGCPGVTICASLLQPSGVHLSFADLGCCVLEAFYFSRHS